MSFFRSVYYSTFISGWAAFLGWFVSELLRTGLKPTTETAVVLTTSIPTGAAIGLGINMVAGMANGQGRQLIRRALPGLVCGGIGGAAGGLIGNLLAHWGLPRAIGWMIVGLGIGVVDGLYERSRRKIRNGLIGGGIGGFIGGMIFDPIVNLTATESGIASRAIAFSVLGLCVGFSIGLVQVVLREAWLTVMDGYRTGRQLTLGLPRTILGRGEHLPLPFLGPSNNDLEIEHIAITRAADGTYCLEDQRTKLGTRLNSQPVQGSSPLRDGDIIRLGTNLVRFNERRRSAAERLPVAIPVRAVPMPPPPPAPRKPPIGAFSQGSSPWHSPPPPPPDAPAQSPPPPISMPPAMQARTVIPPPPPPSR